MPPSMHPGDSDQAMAAARENSSYCKAAFDSLHVAIGGGVKPCCLFQGDLGNVSKATLGEMWNGAQLHGLRRRMMRDERDVRCKTCYDMEDAGGQSLRHMVNAGTAFADFDTAVGKLPKKLDIRLSNLCNLKCRTCGPHESSRWHGDARKLGWDVGPSPLIESFGKGPAALEALEPLLDTIEAINFAGGEPLIHDEHYAIVEDLIRRGRTDVRLTYISNLTELRFRKHDVLALWARFPNVELIASIDGHRRIGELVRDGISWDRFAGHVSAIRAACPHVEMLFNLTVSIFNVHSLPDLCRSLREIDGAADVLQNFNVRQEPRQLSIQVLPADMKAKVQRDLEAFANEYEGTPSLSREALETQIKAVVSYMNFEDGSDHIKRFRKDTLALDAMRGQNTAAVIPELAPILREGFFEARMRKARETGTSLLRLSAKAT